jgi:hypothetical protein
MPQEIKPTQADGIYAGRTIDTDVFACGLIQLNTRNS